jgi:hypothetical protein
MKIDVQTVVALFVAAAAVVYLGFRGFHFFRSGAAGGCSACSSSNCTAEQAVHEIQRRPSPSDSVPDGENDPVSLSSKE